MRKLYEPDADAVERMRASKEADLRLRCLELAIERQASNPPVEQLVAEAAAFAAFVLGAGVGDQRA